LLVVNGCCFYFCFRSWHLHSALRTSWNRRALSQRQSTQTPHSWLAFQSSCGGAVRWSGRL